MKHSKTFYSVLSVLYIFLSLAFAGQIRLAVTNLEYNNIDRMDAQAITERLRIELARTNAFLLIERQLMDKIIEEQKFQTSGCTSNACLVELGHLLNADCILGGSVSKIGSLYSVSVRMIHVESGVITRTALYDHEGFIEDFVKIGIRAVAQELAEESSNESAAPAGQISEESFLIPEEFTIFAGFDWSNTLVYSSETSRLEYDLENGVSLGIETEWKVNRILNVGVGGQYQFRRDFGDYNLSYTGYPVYGLVRLRLNESSEFGFTSLHDLDASFVWITVKLGAQFFDSDPIMESEDPAVDAGFSQSSGFYWSLGFNWIYRYANFEMTYCRGSGTEKYLAGELDMEHDRFQLMVGLPLQRVFNKL